MELLTLSIGVGLAVGLVFGELFGLAAGGVVVPGYIALHMSHPMSVLYTLGAAFLTFALVKASSSLFVLYGRRRTALMILVGYMIGMWGESLKAQGMFAWTDEGAVIGYIIPGLIAIWFDRQGPIVTTCALTIAATVVRLILILLVGLEIRL